MSHSFLETQNYKMNQETPQLEIISENLHQESIDFSLLRLHSFNSNSIPPTQSHCHSPCTACGCGGSSILATNKRRCPDLNEPKLAQDQEAQILKKPKKLFLESQEQTKKITLPCNPDQALTTNSFPFLRRCHSDPYSPPVARSESLSGSGALNLDPQSPPQDSKIGGPTTVTTPVSNADPSLSPRPPILMRSVSMSEPSPYKSYSRSSSSNDMTVDGSSHYQWMKKIRERVREMNEWWNEVMPPDEMMCEEKQGPEELEDDTAIAAVKDGSERECEEAVSVKRRGEWFVVKVECPCGKACQIFYSATRTECYYKLF